MELLRHVSNTQFLYPAAAVIVVLICAGFVFMFGFHSAEQPQFDKLPLILDDKKSIKKKKIKDKKSSPNRNSTEDAKSKSDSSKKSPTKDKKEEKVKEAEKPKPKEQVVQPKLKKDAVTSDIKKGKKSKALDAQKPEDFDEGEWKEVPKKSDKKKVKGTEEKKVSPIKKNKKKEKDADVEAARPADDTEDDNGQTVLVSVTGPVVDEEMQRALEAQVLELQRVLKEAELREQNALGSIEEDENAAVEDLPDVKDLRSNKKKENKEKENKEKQKKQKANEATSTVKNTLPAEDDEKVSGSSEQQEEKLNAPAFDELGDSWSEAKAPKKSKKKARKE